MLELLNAWDTELFLTLNGLHTSWLDPIFWIISGTKTWIPFYAWLLYIILKKDTNSFQQVDWRQIVALLVSVVLLITTADQLASGFLKPTIARYRPSHEPALEGLVHLWVYDTGDFYKGGKYGFVSSHAANSFALAIFVIRTVSKKWLTNLMLVWAIIVSYSRIYLGVHYPGDILGGATIGILSGILWSYAYAQFKTFLQNRSLT